VKRAESGRESESGCTASVQLFCKKTISSFGQYIMVRAIKMFPELHSANTGMHITYAGLYLKNIKESERRVIPCLIASEMKRRVWSLKLDSESAEVVT
jgi:hypothetical protein